MFETDLLDCPPAVPDDGFPKLSDEALIGLPGTIVKLACKDSEAHPAAVLFTALAFAAATFGAISYFPVGDTKHPPRLFTCIVGQSARARKGTSAHPVERIFQTAQEQYGLPPLTVTPGPFSSGEGIINAVRDASEIMKKGEPIDMGVSDKRLLAILGEFGGTLASMARQGSTLSAVLRTAWDTGNIKPMTKLSQIKTTGAHINFVGHITKQELDHLLSTSDVWNGLANRLLWVCARRERLVPLPEPMDEKAVVALSKELGAAIRFAQTAGRIAFADDAKDLWISLYHEISTDEPHVVGIVTARSEPQLLRLAMIYALLDKSFFIEKQHINAAFAAWNYCEQSAAYLFGKAQTNPRAARVLDFLATGPKTKTELHHLFGRNLQAVALNALLADLETKGQIESTGGGKAGRTYALADK